ncbi:DUF669 domain-containing protein [Tundrisphaera lichenicola]|uniref:DUF669 domain-containing protein n=1 Tax=Tundrisphaera lichenicola TaxID=2029860 RepID=UPI003EBD7719
MAFLGQEFNAEAIEPSKPRENIPPGWYKAIIEASDVKPTKKAAEAQQYGSEGANDRLLAMTFKVIEGAFDGALIFNNLNIVNSNPVAQEIAQKDFSAICHAIGKLRVKDSNELHNRPLMIKVDVEKKEGYNARNIIKGYEAVGGASSASAPASTGTAAATGAKAAPAWAKK